MLADQVLLECLGLVDDYWEWLEVCKEGKKRFPSASLYRTGFKQFKDRFEEKRLWLREIATPPSKINK